MNLQSRRREQITNWKSQATRLVTEIRDCLAVKSDIAVNLSRPRHAAITMALRRLAYDEKFGKFPVVYADGSKSAFPVGRLETNKKPSLRGLLRLKLGLTSFRHTDMDFLVDLYLLSNRRLNDSVTFAEMEEQAFKAGVELFTDPLLGKGAVIHVLHTGLEAVVVGFYRSVIAELDYRQSHLHKSDLVIIPCFYAEDQVSGPYDADTPGANLSSYYRSKPWW